MDKITKDDEYEIIYIKHKPFYEEYVRAIVIVKQFIISKKLIVYGGTAIDFALRLKGEQIYNDEILKFADLDFLSSNHAEDAYELADILYKNGFPDVRAIGASHYSTMRIDAVNAISGHFVADISYLPDEMISRIPILEFQGMKFVHPSFQYVDMHSSLAFPYYGAPRENIFNRCKKDIERFNKLYKYYYFNPVNNSTKLKEYNVPISSKYLLTGFSAYSIFYHYIESQKLLDNKLIKLPLETSPEDYLDICHLDPDSLLNDEYHKYHPLGSLLPETYIISMKNTTTKLRVISTKDKMIAINEIKLKIGNEVENLRIVNIQGLLCWFLSMHFAQNSPLKSHQNVVGASDDITDVKNTQKSHEVTSSEIKYINYYISLLTMINLVEDNYDKIDKNIANIFFPSVMTYGNNNLDPTYKININRVNNSLYNDDIIYSKPFNYFPNREKPHPKFDYNAPFFTLDGSEII